MKRQDVLESDVSLIELDLLRGGRRIVAQAEPGNDDLRAGTAADVPRSGQPRMARRESRVAYQIFPVSLRACLPCIPVPLKHDAEEVPLDLQYIFNRVYETGPYRRGAVDYSRTPPPPDWRPTMPPGPRN